MKNRERPRMSPPLSTNLQSRSRIRRDTRGKVPNFNPTVLQSNVRYVSIQGKLPQRPCQYRLYQPHDGLMTSSIPYPSTKYASSQDRLSKQYYKRLLYCCDYDVIHSQRSNNSTSIVLCPGTQHTQHQGQNPFQSLPYRAPYLIMT